DKSNSLPVVSLRSFLRLAWIHVQALNIVPHNKNKEPKEILDKSFFLRINIKNNAWFCFFGKAFLRRGN
ncbi:hypothetical protein, partial [Mycoplasmoides pneumoniae]|uniref:hypothetical protein n=1 Tax=Mycoplasmoides pneumoniae TaxID=2104 RepID=UPI001F1B9DE1